MLYTQNTQILNSNLEIKQNIPVYTVMEENGSEVLMVSSRLCDITEYLIITVKDLLDTDKVKIAHQRITSDKWRVCVYDIKDKYNNFIYIVQKF